MYVMNISSLERGFAGGLRSPGEGALPSRDWGRGPERGAGNRVSETRFQGSPPTPQTPWALGGQEPVGQP